MLCLVFLIPPSICNRQHQHSRREKTKVSNIFSRASYVVVYVVVVCVCVVLDSRVHLRSGKKIFVYRSSIWGKLRPNKQNNN